MNWRVSGGTSVQPLTDATSDPAAVPRRPTRHGPPVAPLMPFWLAAITATASGLILAAAFAPVELVAVGRAVGGAVAGGRARAQTLRRGCGSGCWPASASSCR